jgi:DNA replication protein DnaC
VKILTEAERDKKIRKIILSDREDLLKKYSDNEVAYSLMSSSSNAPAKNPLEKPRSISDGLWYPEDFQNKYPGIINSVNKDIISGNGFHYLIVGNVGCGKTYLAYIISKTIEKIYGYRTKWINCEETYYNYLHLRESTPSNKAQLLSDSVKLLRGKCVVFDDIGAEMPQTDAAHTYVAKLLTDRYNCYKQGMLPFSISTSNLNSDLIDQYYGTRVRRRLDEMCVIIQMKDNFKMKTHKKYTG